MQKLSSNEIKRLRSLSQKKFRDELGLFIVEGEKMVAEAMASEFKVENVYRREEIGEETMSRISQLSSPSPVLAVVRRPDGLHLRDIEDIRQALCGTGGLYLALDSIRDPGNRGTILRIADWFGIDAVFASPDTVDVFNPKVVQSTMGAIFRVRFHYADIPALAGNDGIQLLQGGDSGSIAVLFNKKDGIAADADFRRAVSLLADRNTLMAACYGSYGYNLSTSYMETDQEEWKAAGSDPFGHEDDALGAEYLAASGYSGSTVRILSSNLSGLDRIALALSSELGQAGIDTEVTVLDWASFLERRKDPSAWDLSVSAFSRVTLPQLKSYLSPSFPGWTETDLLERLGEAGSLEEAEEAWRAIQPLLWEEVPAMILGHYSTVYAADSDIQGIITGEGIYFWDASLR